MNIIDKKFCISWVFLFIEFGFISIVCIKRTQDINSIKYINLICNDGISLFFSNFWDVLVKKYF